MGQNYLKFLFDVDFQGILILVCVGIYAVLVQGIAAGGGPISRQSRKKAVRRRHLRRCRQRNIFLLIAVLSLLLIWKGANRTVPGPVVQETPYEVTGVVVHDTGNPGTTAEQNRGYFKNLTETKGTYASSHFVIEIDGYLMQYVPLNEVAYCSNHRNNDTISIECCHADDTGQFSPATLDALIQLLNWLISTYELGQDGILRYYERVSILFC